MEDSNIHYPPEFRRLLREGGQPPYDGSMEARLSTVEQAISRIDATLPHLATKADVSDGFKSMSHWILGTAVALGATAITVMTFVLNNATPKAPLAAPVAQQAPIIINVPAPQAAPPGKH